MLVNIGKVPYLPTVGLIIFNIILIVPLLNRKVGTKDHIEKIDFQELIFAVVNWPNSEFYGAFVCIIRKLG